jgi:hypothetical protein
MMSGTVTSQRWRRATAAAIAAIGFVALAAVSGCGGDDDPEPGLSPTTAAPHASPTPGTGITVIDRAVEAIAMRDSTALAGLVAVRELPCSNAAGIGGPPPCGTARDPLPEGTLVSVFPWNTCEREWQTDIDAWAGRFVDRLGDLYAVARLDTFTPQEELPDGGYAIIFEEANPAFQTAHALIATEDGIVAADSTCGGPPSTFLLDQPPFHAPEVILRGPSFDEE